MPKIRKKRPGFVIDMTPLVDITFLLLTFLMFTAKFKSDAENEQKFKIERPQAHADTTKLPEHDLALIKIAIDEKNPTDTSFYYGLTNNTDKEKVWANIPNLPPDSRDKSLVKVDSVTLGKFIRTTIAVNGKTKFAIDADKGIRYKYIDEAQEIMRNSRAYVFNYVTEKQKEEDKK